MRSFNGSDTGSETPRYGFESHTCTLNAFGRLTHGVRVPPFMSYQTLKHGGSDRFESYIAYIFETGVTNFCDLIERF
jgi:hypothetical protein